MKRLACILFILFNCNAIKSLAAFELEKYSLTSFLTNVSTVWIDLEDVLQQDDLNWYNPAIDGSYTSVIQLNNVPFKNPFDELVNSNFEVVLLGNGMARVVSGGGGFAEYVKNGFKINASTLDDAFKHVDDFVPNGTGKPTFNAEKIVGCHNEVNFNAQRVSNGGRIEVISETPTGVTGVKNIEYKTLKLDNQGNPIVGQYVSNGSTHVKTVYDPTIFPEASMKDLGYKSFKDAMDNPTKIDINGPRTFEGSANGRTISGYYNEVNGEKIISTWWIKN